MGGVAKNEPRWVETLLILNPPLGHTKIKKYFET